MNQLDNNTNDKQEETNDEVDTERREAIDKLSKYAYAVPIITASMISKKA